MSLLNIVYNNPNTYKEFFDETLLAFVYKQKEIITLQTVR